MSGWCLSISRSAAISQSSGSHYIVHRQNDEGQSEKRCVPDLLSPQRFLKRPLPLLRRIWNAFFLNSSDLWGRLRPPWKIVPANTVVILERTSDLPNFKSLQTFWSLNEFWLCKQISLSHFLLSTSTLAASRILICEDSSSISCLLQGKSRNNTFTTKKIKQKKHKYWRRPN